MKIYEALTGNLDVWRVLNNTIYAKRSGFSFEALGGTAWGLRMSGVTTPGASAAYGGLDITLLTNEDQRIDILAAPLVLNVTYNYLHSLSLSLSDPRVLALNYLDLNLSLHNPVPRQGHLRIRLPPGFALDASRTRITQLAGGAAMDGNLTAVLVDAATAELKLERDGLTPSVAGGAHLLRLHGVINPEYEMTAAVADLELSSHDEAGRYIDVFRIPELDQVDEYQRRILPPDDLYIAPHDLEGANTTLDNFHAGETTDGSISATLRNPLPLGGKVVVVFPSGFKLPDVPTATIVVTSTDNTTVELGAAQLHVSGETISTPSSTADGSPQLTLQDRQNSTIGDVSSHRRLRHVPQSLAGAGAVITVHFFGLVIPCWQQTTASFELYTTTAEGKTVDLLRPAAAAATQLDMLSNALTQPSVSLLNPTTGALTDATVSFRVFNAVPPGGAVRITFPPGFTFYGPGDEGSFTFGGAVTASSSALAHQSGDPLDAVSSGGLVALADDSVVHVYRDSFCPPTTDCPPAEDSCFAFGGTCAQCRISVKLTNVRVPLFDGQMGPFEVATLTKQGRIIEQLEVDDPGRYVDVGFGWWAPNPPPPDASPAATRGGGGAAAAGLAVATALLLHSVARWTDGATS